MRQVSHSNVTQTIKYIIHTLILLGVATLTSACGGESTSSSGGKVNSSSSSSSSSSGNSSGNLGQIKQFEVKVSFPLKHSQLGGTNSTNVLGYLVPIGGVSSAPDGVLTVNGIAATFSSENPLQWSAEVPLELDAENLWNIEYTPSVGEGDVMQMQVHNDSVIPAGRHRTLDADWENNRILALTTDHKIIEIDLESSQINSIVDIDLSNGEDLHNMYPLHLTFNSSENKVYFTTLISRIGGFDTLYSVDLDDGTISTVLSALELTARANLVQEESLIVNSVTLDKENQRLLFPLEIGDLVAIYWYDIASGNVSLLRGDTYIPQFEGDKTITHTLTNLDKQNKRVITGDWNYGLVREVNLENGDTRVVVENNDGNDIEFEQVISIQIDPANNRALVSDNQLGLLAWVDLVTGERSLVMSKTKGRGPYHSTISEMHIDLENRRAFYAGGPNIYVVNLETGDRAILPTN